ncbi:MAG: FHA domain-containing protein [Gammaproteobacteria bacterium]
MIQVRRYAPDGAHTEQAVDGAITVGRGTDNSIQLPGLLVALHHLRLSPAGMRVQLECLSPAGVIVNGLPAERTAELLPGDELRVGGHRIRVSLDAAGSGLMLEVHEHDAQGGAAAQGALTSLEAAGWRMRRASLIGAGAVLVLLLLLPLVLRALPLPSWLGNWIPTERLWSSGEISAAHKHFGVQCSSCHESLFVPVRDRSCLNCHAALAHHGDDPEALAHAGLDTQRCASCHFEHGDAHAVLPQHPGICVDCHEDPDDFPALGSTGAVSDFAGSHPPFRVTVTTIRDGQPQALRSLLAEGVQDNSALIYPHDLHLDPKGVRGPDGLEELVCGDCHEPGPGDVGFQPLQYEPHCQRCHQLDVTVGGLPYRLPHGNSDAVRALLESAVGMPAAVATPPPEPEDGDRRRPGERAERGDGASAVDEIDEVFERRVCAKCHEVDKAEDRAAAVRAPMLRKTWMPMARFTHAPHEWVPCKSCHAVTVSSDSIDLLLPQIETCRLCHGGVESSAQIQSTCIDCHRFHQAEALTMSKFMGELADGQTLETGQ